MRRLMLLRHAKTETDAPSGRDQDRRLDDRGRRDAAEIGGWIGRHLPFPDSVLVSPAIRAHQTWEIARQAMKDLRKDLGPEPQVELLPELYGADRSQLLRTVRSVSVTDPQRLMLVGHNPQFDQLAPYLLGASHLAVDFKKGAIMRIDIENFGARPKGTLCWYLTAKLSSSRE